MGWLDRAGAGVAWVVVLRVALGVGLDGSGWRRMVGMSPDWDGGLVFAGAIVGE